MRRSPRSLLTAALALLVATATAWTVGSDLAALHRRARELGPPRPVVIAARDLPLGARVGAADLRTVDRHASTVPDRTLRDPSEAIGRVVAVPVLAGALVTGRHLAAADRPGTDGLVAPGTRAVHLRTQDGLRPRPGAVVDVLATLDPGLAGETTVGPPGGAVTVASAARVLAVDEGDGATDASYDAAAAGGVTLLVTEREARTLAFAAANGVLMLALAPPEDACCPPPAP